MACNNVSIDATRGAGRGGGGEGVRYNQLQYNFRRLIGYIEYIIMYCVLIKKIYVKEWGSSIMCMYIWDIEIRKDIYTYVHFWDDKKFNKFVR